MEAALATRAWFMQLPRGQPPALVDHARTQMPVALVESSSIRMASAQFTRPP
ncbi:MAG TPA: hypothetical protein VGM39_22475 [Kofleriaceae bacterium]